MLSRRRFMQLGASAVLLPLAMEGAADAAGATEQRISKVKANPKAILQFGQMQGESYDPIRQVGVEYIQLYALFDMLLSYTESGAIVPRLATYQASIGCSTTRPRPSPPMSPCCRASRWWTPTRWT
jgi:hypothetical protein